MIFYIYEKCKLIGTDGLEGKYFYFLEMDNN